MNQYNTINSLKALVTNFFVLFYLKWMKSGIPRFLLFGALSGFCEQVSVHLRLIVLVKIPAEFAVATCFPSSLYTLRGAIQRRLTAKCVRRGTLRDRFVLGSRLMLPRPFGF